MEAGPLIRGLAAIIPTPTVIARAASVCSAVSLPSGGFLSLPDGSIVTLTATAVFSPACTAENIPAIIAHGGGGGITIDDSSMLDDVDPDMAGFGLDPFYASTFPQFYALAATTVIAYTLVIMLFITPRSFLDGGVVVLGRRGFTNGGSGGTSIGGRPWLQKVAALTVAISLTIATVDTFAVAEEQYYIMNSPNAKNLQEQVLGHTQLQVIRIISDTFLWLAQAQTLIRLFPRQREKIIIKWAAFALITLDLIFQSLNTFVYTNTNSARPRSFTDAVPALSYLFQLTLGVLYAAWVLYYAIMKKRYAFYHRQMRNICLVALLSILAVLVPVVFFILDISKPDFTAWGDYVRWVGAAAASVIVWEWVERIEALEREEKKGGILGREVFDGDEMLDMSHSDMAWPRRRRNRKSKDDEDSENGGGPVSGEGAAPAQTRPLGGGGGVWPAVTSLTARYRSRSRPRNAEEPSQPSTTQNTNNERIGARFLQPPLWPARPAPAVTPVSRTDTASAASTVYAVRYHPLTETTSRSSPPIAASAGRAQTQPQRSLSRSNSTTSSMAERDEGAAAADTIGATADTALPSDSKSNPANSQRWRRLAHNPFRRTPGSETSAHGGKASRRERWLQQDDNGRWDIRSRLEDYAASQAEKLRERIRPTQDTENLPVVVVAAPARRGAALAQLLEEEEAATRREGASDQVDDLGMTVDAGREVSADRDASLAPALWRARGSSYSAREGPPATASAAQQPGCGEVQLRQQGEQQTAQRDQPSPTALGKQRAGSRGEGGSAGSGNSSNA